MKEATLSKFREYKEAINNTRRRGGQYWANIVAMKLLQADKELGTAETNRLIRECKLEKYGWHEHAETGS